MAALPLRVQERSFEVRPQHAGSGAVRFPGLGGDRRKRGRVLQRRGDDGRQEPGDAGLRQAARDLPDRLHAGGRIMAAIAVYLEVDESRRDDGVFSPQVLDITRLTPLSRADPGDPAVFDEDRTRWDLFGRGDDGAAQEEPHQSVARTRTAPCTRALSLANDAQRAVCDSPQSGLTLSRSAGTYRRQARMRCSMSSAVST